MFALLSMSLFSFQGANFLSLWFYLVFSVLSYETFFKPLTAFSMEFGFSRERRVQRYANERKIRRPRKMVGLSGLEPPTSRLSGVRSNRLSYKPILPFGSDQTHIFNLYQVVGGDMRDRTADPLLAKQVLSQLSYTPIFPFESTKMYLQN